MKFKIEVLHTGQQTNPSSLLIDELKEAIGGYILIKPLN
jgi:hypothetical protein